MMKNLQIELFQFLNNPLCNISRFPAAYVLRKLTNVETESETTLF